MDAQHAQDILDAYWASQPPCDERLSPRHCGCSTPDYGIDYDKWFSVGLAMEEIKGR